MEFSWLKRVIIWQRIKDRPIDSPGNDRSEVGYRKKSERLELLTKDSLMMINNISSAGTHCSYTQPEWQVCCKMPCSMPLTPVSASALAPPATGHAEPCLDVAQ